MCTLLALAGCVQQRIRDESLIQMRAGHYEQATMVLESGLQTYPESALLRAGLLETKAEVLARVLAQAGSARAEGQLDDAERVLMRASTLQPNDPRIDAMRSQIATDRRQEAALARARALVDQRRLDAASSTVVEALKAQPRHPELLALKRRIEAEQRQTQLQASQLGLAETRPISIDFRDANLRTVLDAVSRNSGINFVFDKDIRSDVRVTAYLRSVRVEDAVELIVSTNQLAKKVVDSRTMLIYPNTPDKQREHQEQVVRVFHLSGGDAKGAAAFLKSMLKIRDPYVDERTNMLALRESEPNVQMAERLLMLYDTAEPEVLLEVEVIEINTSRLTELGVKFPDFFALTLLPPMGADRLTLANVRGVTRDRIGLSIGGVTVNLKRETGDFNMLANPRIRVRSKEKARVLVGDKIPIVTTTQGSTGFVSDSVSYIDVGLKLEVEPTVYVDDEVAIRIGLEVSSLGSVIKTASGTLAYQIGTRNASTLLRLRDGETQLLAGLISTAERSDASKVPGLGDLPLAGRLFSSQLDNGQRVELVLSITPRVLRSLKRPDIAESEIWVGTEASPRLRPVGGVATSAQAGGDLGGGGDSSSAASSGGGGGGGVAARSWPPQSPVVAPPEASTSASPIASLSGPPSVKAGDTFDVRVAIQSDQPLRGLPVELGYSKGKLELVAIEEAELFRQGGAQTSFTQTIDAGSARASAGVLRTTLTGAVGKGNVLTLRFKALAAGLAEVALLSMRPIGLAGPVAEPASLPPLKLDIQQVAGTR